MGTCFALHGEPTVIVSAAHVFEGCGTGRFCLLLRDVDDEIYPMVGDSWTADGEHDIALINIPGLPDRISALPLAANMVGLTDPIHTFEFSPTVPRQTADGLRFTPNAYSHVGNIVMHHEDTARDGRVYSRRFETSYPALKGASGSPVMAASNGAVLGVLIRNHSMPLSDDEGVMSFGEAVSLEVLQSLLADNGVQPTAIPV
jgi:hypothetical protein